MKILFAVKIKKIISRKKKFIAKIRFCMMFDFRELKLMFLDPTDLIINNINRFLITNKTIKFIFS